MYRLNDMREARRHIPATSIRLLNTLTNTARKFYTKKKKEKKMWKRRLPTAREQKQLGNTNRVRTADRFECK